MKNYDERIESIFRKYNEKLKEKKRKTAFIRRTAFCASGLCAAVIVCVFALKVPKDYFDYNYDNVIASTENVTDVTSSNSSITTIQTTASSVQTSVTVQTTTASEQSHVASAVTVTSTTDIPKTDTPPVTTSSTAVSATTSAASSSATESQPQTTVVTTQTTTQPDTSTTISTTTTTDDGKSEGITPPPIGTPLISYGGNTYLICQERINAYNTGSVFAENLFTTNPVNSSPTLANLAPIKGFSPDYAVAAQIDSEYYYCKSVNYQPQSLQSFFSDISLETNWDTEAWNFEYENTEKEVLFRLLLSIPDTACVDSDYVGNEIYYKDIYSDINAVPDLRISFTSKGYIIVRNGMYPDKYFIGEEKVSEIVGILKKQ